MNLRTTIKAFIQQARARRLKANNDLSFKTTIKAFIQQARARRLKANNDLRKLSNDARGALFSLALNAFLCLVDGEISEEEIQELREDWIEFIKKVRE